jgi:hypothetical protein
VGSSTQAHAGFLLKGKDITDVIPSDEEGLLVFGTHTFSPFKEEHYVQLIGRTFKKQFQPMSWSGRRPSKLTYTLQINPPLPSRLDVPFSLVMTSRDFRIDYPVPAGADAESTVPSKTISCCGKEHRRYQQRFCGECGNPLISRIGTVLVDNLNGLFAHTPMFCVGSPEHHFNLRDEAVLEEVTVPATYYDDDLHDLAGAIAEKVGAHSTSIGHMKGWVFILVPRDCGSLSIDLWSDDEPYIKLSDIDDHRERINAVGDRLKELGFEPKFVIHPEWIE